MTQRKPRRSRVMRLCKWLNDKGRERNQRSTAAPRPEPREIDLDFVQEYEKMLKGIRVCPIGKQKAWHVDWAVDRIHKNMQAYMEAATYCQQERHPYATWWAIAILHMMEAGGRMDRQFLNGEKWKNLTKKHPAGKGPWKSFAHSCISAFNEHPLPRLSREGIPGEHELALFLDYCERYNGLGYRKYKSMRSPYLFSYSQYQSSGKYIADGKFDKDAISLQVGAAVLLKEMFGKE